MKRLFFLAAGMFAMGCEDYLFAGLLPGICLSLHSSIVIVAQGCAAFGIAYIVSVPICAFLLSRFSAQRVLATALIVFIVGNVLTLLSMNIILYLVARFVSGLGAGLFLPVAVSAATQMVDPSSRGKAISYMWGANSAGAVVGVPVGLSLASKMGWRATVVLILILAVFALVGIIFHKQKFLVDRSPPSLRDQLRLLVNRQVLEVIAVTLLTSTGCLGLYAYITQVLSGTEKSPEIAFSLWSIGGLIGSAGIGYVIDRVGKPQLVMVMILAALFLVVISIPVVRSIPILGFLPFIFWGALGWSTVTTQQYSLMRIKPNHEAILVALNSSAFSHGSVVGTALGGIALSGGVIASHLPYLTAIFLFCAFVWQTVLIPYAKK